MTASVNESDPRERSVDRLVSHQLFKRIDRGVLIGIECVFERGIDREDVLRCAGVETVGDRMVWMSDSPSVRVDFLVCDIIAVVGIDRDGIKIFERRNRNCLDIFDQPRPDYISPDGLRYRGRYERQPVLDGWIIRIDYMFEECPSVCSRCLVEFATDALIVRSKHVPVCVTTAVFLERGRECRFELHDSVVNCVHVAVCKTVEQIVEFGD